MEYRKLARKVAIVLSGCILAFALCACVAAPEENSEASQNRQCLSLMSSRISDLQETMGEFETAASEQNIVGMKAQLDKAEGILAEIREQEATDALTDVKDAYVEALDGLEQAMASYVGVYERIQNGEITASDAQSEIEGIQASYDEAVEKLEEADDAVKKLAE